MSIVAHAGAGIVNTWGFAYVGGIVGLISSALFYVHRSVALRAADAPMPSFPLRWIVPIGFVAGISIGLGAGRVLASALEAPPTAEELVERICLAIDSDGLDPFDDLHGDLEHFASDHDDAAVASAHDALVDAIAADRTSIGVEVQQLIGALGVPADQAAAVCDPAAASLGD